MTGKITNIIYNGMTYEVTALIDGVDVVFFTTHPYEEELQYHLRKQYEMIRNCQNVSKQYLGTFKAFIGREMVIDEGAAVAH